MPATKKQARKRKGTKKTTGRKGGRKKGTPNHTYETVRSVPKRCPKCLSTAVVTSRVLNRLSHRGIAPDGMPYTSIVRKRGQCEACNQMLIVTEYHHESDIDPESEKDSGISV